MYIYIYVYDTCVYIYIYIIACFFSGQNIVCPLQQL